MSSLLAPLPNSAIWRVASVLGVLFSILAGEAVALQARNGSRVPDTADANVASVNKHPGGQILAMPLKRIDHKGVATPSIGRRFFKADVLGVFGAAYMAELTIGTSSDGKKQVIDVLIDTGSFELWVNPVCSASNVPEFCEVFGHYNPALSSTSQKVSGQFGIKYGSGQVSGDYYKDDIYISGAKVEGQQFGVANSSELVWFGILGLAHGQGNGFIKYPVLIDSLAARGLANTKLFSIDLGKQFSPGGAITGELVFGGVDTNKYAGFLKKVPTDLYDPITLNSIAHRAPGSGVSTPFIDPSLPISVIVDSGTTLSLLPEPIVQKLAEQFPGAEPDGAGGYRVDCAYQNLGGSVDFSFLSENGTVTINVGYRDFIWNSGGDCFLGVWSSNDLGVWILGDTFLRGAYIAFDQTNNALFMSNYVSCGDGQSNLVTVPAGPDSAAKIPGACSVIAAPPPASSSASVSVAKFPGGTISSTVIPTSASTRGPTLNPLEPPHATTPMTSAPSDLVPIQSPSLGDLKSTVVGSLTDADPEASPALKQPDGLGDPGMTITNTITRAVVYTVVGACPDSVVNCPFRNQVATRFEIVTTTFCPGHDDSISVPHATPAATSGASKVIFVTEASAPASTHVLEIGATGPNKAQIEEEEEGEQVIITTLYPTTTTYKIASCAPGDDACATDMTVTRVTTLAKTVVVHPVSTSSVSNIAPEGEIAAGKNNPHHNNKNATSTWNGNGNQTRPVVISAAAPVDDAKVDKRYLGAGMMFVWGIMMLL